jgi:predicted CXXCH cytochrome family protein
MKLWTVATGICVAVALSAGCSATTRHSVLTYFFDGVPPLREAVSAAEPSGGPAGSAPASQVTRRDHGPYAAKLCSACHNTGATNALVAPGEELCFKCHDLRLDKKYIHGPLASGGCLQCHDPHGSRYRYLLVSDSESFCLRCHDREALEGTGTHAGSQEPCTACHDAHMSDNEYLLK